MIFSPLKSTCFTGLYYYMWFAMHTYIKCISSFSARLIRATGVNANVHNIVNLLNWITQCGREIEQLLEHIVFHGGEHERTRTRMRARMQCKFTYLYRECWNVKPIVIELDCIDSIICASSSINSFHIRLIHFVCVFISPKKNAVGKNYMTQIFIYPEIVSMPFHWRIWFALKNAIRPWAREVRQYLPHNILDTISLFIRCMFVFCRKRWRIHTSKTNLAYHFGFSQECPLRSGYGIAFGPFVSLQSVLHTHALSCYLYVVCVFVLFVSVSVSALVDIVFHCMFLIVILLFVEKLKPQTWASLVCALIIWRMQPAVPALYRACDRVNAVVFYF